MYSWYALQLQGVYDTVAGRLHHPRGPADPPYDLPDMVFVVNAAGAAAGGSVRVHTRTWQLGGAMATVCVAFGAVCTVFVVAYGPPLKPCPGHAPNRQHAALRAVLAGARALPPGASCARGLDLRHRPLLLVCCSGTAGHRSADS